jgi:hypothetical protein
MTTSARRERSPWCQQWIRSLGGQPERPPDRHERLKEALAERDVPYSRGIEHVDEVLFGLRLGAQGFGIVEAIAARRSVPPDDFPWTSEGTLLVPVTVPHNYSPEWWCDSAGAMYAVLYDLGVCQPTFDSAEHLLECKALQAVHLEARGDQYSFETAAYLGEVAASALTLATLPEVEGKRCHAWSGERAIVVEARLEQYLYGTYIGLRDGSAVGDLLSRLPKEMQKALRVIRAPDVAAADRAGAPVAAHDLSYGKMLIYRWGEEVLARYEPPA